MNDLISRAALLQEFETQTKVYRPNELWHITGIKAFIENAPTVDAVPKSYADQIRWECDIAIEQLEEIGCQLGQKMDDVKKKLDAKPVVHGKWIKGYLGEWKCSVCREENCYAYDENIKKFTDLYCPNCGARMDGE